MEEIYYLQEVSLDITWPHMGIENTPEPDEDTALGIIKDS